VLLLSLFFALFGCSGGTQGSGGSSSQGTSSSSSQATGSSSSESAGSSASQTLGSSDEAINTDSVLANAKVGDIIHLGVVSFTNNQGRKFSDDIGWRVLAVENDRLLVISRDSIDFRSYDRNNFPITWEPSALRAWLNSNFYDGLPKEMRDRTLTTLVTESDNLHFGTKGSNDTNDKVFLLSVIEAESYFSSDDDRKAVFNFTPKDISELNVNKVPGQGQMGLEDYLNHFGGIGWWLRSLGMDGAGSDGFGRAAVVDSDGRVGIGSFTSHHAGVRPALWLSL